MNAELDLSFLTPKEIKHILSVLERAKKIDETHQEKKKYNKKNFASDDIIRSEWKRKQPQAETTNVTYIPACDAVSAALNEQFSTKNLETSEDDDSVWEDQASPCQIKPLKDHSNDDILPLTVPSTPIKFYRDESEFSESTSSSASSPVLVKKERPVLIYTPPSRDNLFRENRPLFLNAKTKHSESATLTSNYDTKSMISRSTLPSRDYVGTIDITLTYFPPYDVKQKTFPSKGTRFPENKNLDVLTRKTYASRSGAKISLVKGNKTGARADKDGELHLFISGANDLNLPRGAREGEKTYVKCYLLPDRYHGSKMKSETVKDTINPRYEHMFVFRGFSEKEFNERSIEIVVGGITSAHGRHLVVGGIRLSNGEPNSSGLVPWKDLSLDESTIWKKAFDQPSVEVSSSIILRPRIKLTYK